MAKSKQAGTPATVQLSALGIAFEIIEYDHDPHCTDYGNEAVAQLGLPAESIFKTLIVEVDQRLTVAVVPVSGTLDLKRMAAVCGAKRAVMAPAAVAERKTGYVLGGVSPIGQRSQLPTVIDESALRWEHVLVSAGKRGCDVRLAPGDLVSTTGAQLADIARHA